MADFHGIVRPYLRPDYSPPRRIVSANPPQNQENLIIIAAKGAGGTAKMFSSSYSLSISNYMVKQVRENDQWAPGFASINTDIIHISLP